MSKMQTEIQITALNVANAHFPLSGERNGAGQHVTHSRVRFASTKPIINPPRSSCICQTFVEQLVS